MADFPIYQSQRSLPGVAPNVEANLDVRTGAGQESAAMGQAGAQLAQLGVQMYQMQGEVELARAQNEDADAINKMFLGFEKNLDPETYAQEYQSTLSEIENREVKNGWAARRRNINLARAKPGWEFGVHAAAIKKTTENYKDEIALKVSRAIDTGNLTDATATIWRGVDEKLISPNEAKLIEDNLIKDAAKRQTEKAVQALVELATSVPSEVLAWKNVSEMKEAIPGSKATHFRYAKDLARATINNRTTMYDADWNAKTNKYLSEIQQETPLYEVQQQILDADDLTPFQKDKMLKTVLGSSKLMADTGTSPWEETLDTQMRDQLAVDIVSGKIKTLGEIDEAWMKDDKINISVRDKAVLDNIYKAKHGSASKKYSMSDPTVKAVYEEIELEFRDENKQVPEDRLGDYFDVLSKADELLSDPGIRKDPEKLFKGLKDELKRVREKETSQVVKQAGFFDALLARDVIPIGGAPFGPATQRPKAQGELGEPKTQVEFEAMVMSLIRNGQKDVSQTYYQRWKGKF